MRLTRQQEADRRSCAPTARRCFGLCCVAPAFAASADFAIDKPAGAPCPNLRADYRCGIHTQLRPRGFPGCTVFDCFGAGQQVAQVTFGGRRLAGATRRSRRDVRGLPGHAARCTNCSGTSPRRATLAAGPDLHAELPNALGADREAHRAAARTIAGTRRRRRTGAGSTAAAPGQRTGPRRSPAGADRRGADLIGRGPARRRSARRQPARRAADRRRPARRRPAAGRRHRRGPARRRPPRRRPARRLFLTQAQLDAASGDARSRLPATLTRPAHWPGR